MPRPQESLETLLGTDPSTVESTLRTWQTLLQLASSSQSSNKNLRKYRFMQEELTRRLQNARAALPDIANNITAVSLVRDSHATSPSITTRDISVAIADCIHMPAQIDTSENAVLLWLGVCFAENYIYIYASDHYFLCIYLL